MTVMIAPDANDKSIISLSNGDKMPQLGLGTWKSKPGEVEAAVKSAIDAGYRHIDCAYAYGNECEVGNAIADKIADGSVKREDVWVTGKLWNTFHRKQFVEEAVKCSLRDLQLEYLDLFLIHWPVDFKCSWTPGEQICFDARKAFPKLETGKMELDEVDLTETWEALEACVDKGLLRNIGLSNFNEKQIEQVHTTARVKPTVLQVECHPFLQQAELLKFCAAKEIAVTAYSPLGGSTNDKPENSPTPLADPVVQEIAATHGKNAGQVCIKWCLQRGVIAVPKSVSPSRIAGNADMSGWALTEADMAKLAELERGFRSCVPQVMVDGKSLPRDADHRDYPFA
ncbi:unnamed protein product [Amoebophrya sp. A25]|nr:unnamed protein product [Amoebophrya sp. A25]|eukprot:GSA25T00002259001.1